MFADEQRAGQFSDESKQISLAMSGRKTYVDNSYNRSLGRVGMPHGSHVVSRSSSSSASGGSSYSAGSKSCYASGTSSERTYVDNSFNRQHGRVGKPVGSHVVSSSSGGNGYSAGSKSCYASGASSERTYVDNSFNRQHGRVGKPVGSHVVSSSSGGSISRSEDGGGSQNTRVYKDNPSNRRLGRVGKPIGTHVLHKDGSVSVSIDGTPIKPRKAPREIITENSIDDIRKKLEEFPVFRFPDPIYDDYQLALDKLQRTRIEDTWRENDIPVTPSDQEPQMTIPFSELKMEKDSIIGKGGFGVVHAALWKGTPVAFKKLHLQQMSTKRKDSFLKEVEIMASLKHNSTVKLFGAVIEKTEIGIVMEYLKRSLFDAIFVDEADFSEDLKKTIGTHIASALDYLHTHAPKIAHCDLKCANVLLDKDDNAKLGDFGLSAIKKATETSTSSMAGAHAAPGQGTPRYSAPEVLRGDLLKMDQLIQTDIYSLAVVAFELIFEEEAYDGLNKTQLEAHVGRGNLRPTSDENVKGCLSGPLAQLLNRCWDSRAANRPTAAEYQLEWSSLTTLYSESN